jgi:TonB family protein
MHIVASLIAVFLTGAILIEQGQPPPAARIRVAVVETSWDQMEFSQTAIQSLRTSLSRIERITVVEPDLVQSAVRGFGYDGSLNLMVSEARDLGAAIGCDFYILGRGRISPRSLNAEQVVHRAWLALFFVDARSGELARFEFMEKEHRDAGAASHSLFSELESKLSLDLDQVRRRNGQIEQSPPGASPDVIEINDPTAPAQAGSVEPPRILSSLKPSYTRTAHMADVFATVELKVTFFPDGSIGPIDVVRWAGFGLDESAIEAARRLRFRPARRHNQPIAARALVQYKFQWKNPTTSPPVR